MRVKTWASRNGVDLDTAVDHIGEILERSDIKASSNLSKGDVDLLDEYELPDESAEETEPEPPVREPRLPTHDPLNPKGDEDVDSEEIVQSLRQSGVKRTNVTKADSSLPKKLFKVSCPGLKRLRSIQLRAVDESEAIRQFILMYELDRIAHRHRFVAEKVG